MWLQDRNLNDKKKENVTKYALMSEASAVVRHFRKNNPHLTESTVRPWVKRYQKLIQEQKKLNPTAQAAAPNIGKAQRETVILGRGALYKDAPNFLILMRPLIFEIIDLALKHNIPDELIINADQTPSKFVATDNVRMAKKGEKYISRAGATDKRAIK